MADIMAAEAAADLEIREATAQAAVPVHILVGPRVPGERSKPGLTELIRTSMAAADHQRAQLAMGITLLQI
jgi:hypothetical protein